ncbi:MAG TPA: hypothetical protein VMX18_02720 [Candidatus Bipolaricaulota bacterium]|nr:hypothetical protein [Candidatus Bipolaricaulota bacterium]
MLLTWILVGVIGVCLGLIVYILIKKLPQVKTLDISTISREKENETRDKILSDRLKRKTQRTKDLFTKGLAPAWAKFSDWLKAFRAKVQDLEKKYKREEVKQTASDAVEFKKRINQLLAEAQEAVKKEDMADAEKKYIEIISLSPQEKGAFKGLGDLYYKKKEFKSALETYKFVLKLDLKISQEVTKQEDNREVRTFSNSIELADDYVDLGEVALAMGSYKMSVDYFKRAVSLEPNNPRNLDLLIEASIAANNKLLAMEALNGLKRINPDNQKLRDYAEKIKAMELTKDSKGLNFLW